jgi:hypothetical protein
MLTLQEIERKLRSQESIIDEQEQAIRALVKSCIALGALLILYITIVTLHIVWTL